MTIPAQLVVSRHWHYPQIRVAVSRLDIALVMGFDDVIEALVLEMGSPATMFTQQQLRQRLQNAALRVVDGVKEASAHAPPPADVADPA